MSELKSETIYFTHENGEAYAVDMYIKSEADKVIADLEMKLASAQLVMRLNKPEALFSNLDTMSRLNHQIYVVERRECHHKYKRCLAMARWCESDMEQWVEGSLRWDRRKNWLKRWLELAEKFKEAKR